MTDTGDRLLPGAVRHLHVVAGRRRQHAADRPEDAAVGVPGLHLRRHHHDAGEVGWRNGSGSSCNATVPSSPDIGRGRSTSSSADQTGSDPTTTCSVPTGRRSTTASTGTRCRSSSPRQEYPSHERLRARPDRERSLRQRLPGARRGDRPQDRRRRRCRPVRRAARPVPSGRRSQPTVSCSPPPASPRTRGCRTPTSRPRSTAATPHGPRTSRSAPAVPWPTQWRR
jgi:hypothetical protein